MNQPSFFRHAVLKVHAERIKLLRHGRWCGILLTGFDEVRKLQHVVTYFARMTFYSRYFKPENEDNAVGVLLSELTYAKLIS